MFTLFLRHFFREWKVRALLVGIFMCHWHAPVRYVYHYPASVDPFFFVFLLAGLLLVVRLRAGITPVRIAVLSLLLFVGVCFREVVLLVGLAALFVNNPLSIKALLRGEGVIQGFKKFKPILLWPLMSAVAGIAITHAVASPIGDYSFVAAACSWAYKKRPLPYLLTWFINFGPLLALPLYDWARSWRLMRQQQPLTVLLAAVVLLSWIGGSDTGRILLWSSPVVFVLIGKSIENNLGLLRSVPLILTLVTLQAISMRVLWATPNWPTDYPSQIPLLTPVGEHFPRFDLFTAFCDNRVGFIGLVEYMVCTGVLVAWLRRRAMKVKRHTKSDQTTTDSHSVERNTVS